MIRAEAEVKVAFDSLLEARAIYHAVRPELDSAPADKGRVNMGLTGRNLRLSFEGSDYASFRAAVNSVLRWIITSSSVNALTRRDRSGTDTP